MSEPPVSESMRRTIEDRLAAIEAEEEVRILLAVESGSRGWGFHSPDSDYDVRFVYVRPPDWHVALQRGRDVIERPISDELDLGGWELRKALLLLLKGNAVIGEWLRAPLIYRSKPEAVEALTDLAMRAADRRAATWHYLNVLRSNLDRAGDTGGRRRIKRVFYALRPALALRWMRLRDAGLPPMDMDGLIEGIGLSAGQRNRIEAFTALKKGLGEGDAADVPEAILDLIGEERRLAENWLADEAPPDPSPRLEAEAEALHLRLTRAFGPSGPPRR